ncbi:MAG: hypothetical protein ABI601_05720 [bacterium]
MNVLTAGGGAVVAIAAAARARRMQVIDALLRHGVLAPGPATGTLYIDERAYILHRDARRHQVRFAIVLLLAFALALLATGLLMGLRLA